MTQMIDLARFGTLARAVEETGVSRQWLSFLAATGQIAFTTTPLGRLYDLEDCWKHAELRAARMGAPAISG